MQSAPLAPIAKRRRRFRIRIAATSLVLVGLLSGGLLYPSPALRRLKVYVFYHWPNDGLIVRWAASNLEFRDLSDVEQVVGANLGIRYQPLLESAKCDSGAAVEIFNLIETAGLDGGYAEEYDADCQILLESWPDSNVDSLLDRVNAYARDQLLGSGWDRNNNHAKSDPPLWAHFAASHPHLAKRELQVYQQHPW